MGWVCITDECKGHIDVTGGMWDGTGMAYFSIADEITYIHDAFFSFLLNLSPSIYYVAILVLVLTFAVSVMIGIKRLMLYSANT